MNIFQVDGMRSGERCDSDRSRNIFRVGKNAGAGEVSKASRCLVAQPPKLVTEVRFPIESGQRKPVFCELSVSLYDAACRS